MLAYNVKLKCEDVSGIREILEMEAFCWNIASEFLFENRKASIKELHNAVYSKIRKIRPEIPAQVIIRAYNSCKAAYKSIKSNKHKITKPCIKKNLSIRLDKRLYSYKPNGIKVTTTNGRRFCEFVLYDKVRELLSKYEVKDPLIFERNNELFISLSFDNNEAKKQILDTHICVGIDVGYRNFAATSEGNIYRANELLKYKRKVRFLRNQLKKKRTKSANRKLRKIKNKERNFSKNFVQQISNQILKDIKADVLVFEDLTNIKNKVAKKSSKKTNSKVGQMPFCTLQNVISYKARAIGKIVTTVNPHNTSQIDCRTRIISGIRQKGRYIGHDGKVLNSDLNAAVNIAHKSFIPLSYFDPKMIYGQAVVNQPIVCKPRNSIASHYALACGS